eukprot:8721515-Pyramimonas_sp.AAC.1
MAEPPKPKRPRATWRQARCFLEGGPRPLGVDVMRTKTHDVGGRGATRSAGANVGPPGGAHPFLWGRRRVAGRGRAGGQALRRSVPLRPGAGGPHASRR